MYIYIYIGSCLCVIACRTHICFVWLPSAHTPTHYPDMLPKSCPKVPKVDQRPVKRCPKVSKLCVSVVSLGVDLVDVASQRLPKGCPKAAQKYQIQMAQGVNTSNYTQ